MSFRRAEAQGASPLMMSQPVPRVGSLNAAAEWVHKLDAKRSCRRVARRAIPVLMLLWALMLLGLTFTDYGWIRLPRSRKRLAVPDKNSELVGKRFLLRGPHIMCPVEVKYRLGTPINETGGCRCDGGWEGERCQTAMCAQPCAHGRCVKPNTCKCHPGWKGKLCDVPICDQGGCHHGTCIQPNICACERMWKGPGCNILCVHGEFQTAALGKDGRPVSPCICEEGWHGKGCNEALCTRFGCVNGVCEQPDKCSCDPGWRGADCADSAVQSVSKDILKSIYFDKGEFGSVLINQGTPDKAWKHMKEYSSWSPEAHKLDYKALRNQVPINDTLTGFDWRIAGSRAKKERRGSAVRWWGDEAGLLRTQLGIMIDRHDAVLRFNLAPTAGNQGEPHLMWRPDSYHIYPKLRSCCPQSNVQLLRSDWVDVQVDAYKAILSRLMAAGLVASDDSLDVERHSDAFVDPALFLDGLHRIPTSFIGITLMAQLCNRVNVFGFDPNFIKVKTKGMGIQTDTYYSTQSINAVVASEAEDEAVVYADQDPGGSLRPNRGKDATAFMPDGEPFPGGGGTFAKGALDQIMLQLLEMDGYITLCTSEHPEKCLDSTSRYER